MNFKSFSDSQLVASTSQSVKIETKATTNVVRHFREIFDRKLHLKRGYSSMFVMAVKEFGYDKASAQRRVKAMALSIIAPLLCSRKGSASRKVLKSQHEKS